MHPTLRTSVLVILAFLACYILFRHSAEIAGAVEDIVHAPLLRSFITYVIIGIPIFAGTLVIHRDYRISRYLGLNGSPVLGILLSIAFTLPMFLGGLIFSSFEAGTPAERIIKATLFAGLFEELYFRGFLFGQLFRYTRLGFIPSILLGALLFAAGHLTQSTDPAELAGVFATTFMGAVFFAWLFAEWQYNLWIPVFLHAFMNLSWALFAFGETAAGEVTSNIFRAMTIAAAIVTTILYKRKKGVKLEVNRGTLLWKEGNH